MATVITWHTRTAPDRAALRFIQDGLKANRWTRDAVFEIAEPSSVDPEGSINIRGNPLGRLIDPAEVSAIIEGAFN